jgi:hypothetical protein
LLLASIFGNLGRSYLFGAAAGWGKVQSAARQHGINIGTFSLLRDIDITDRKAVVELPNLKALEAILKETGPKALRDFKTNARQVGKPAQRALISVYKSVGVMGPLGAPNRPGRKYDKMANFAGGSDSQRGRLSYMNGFTVANTRNGVDVNYKNRNEGKALSQLKAAKDGTISIVRLLVKSGPLIVADMAGKSGNGRVKTGNLIRNYQTNLFGRGIVQATDNMRRMTPAREEARTKWLQALDRKAHNRRQSKASRYAWPTMEKYMSKHKVNAASLMNRTITELNKRMEQ